MIFLTPLEVERAGVGARRFVCTVHFRRAGSQSKVNSRVVVDSCGEKVQGGAAAQQALGSACVL